MGFLTLQDLTDLIEVVIMPDELAGALPALAAGGPLLVRGHVEQATHGGATIRATRLRALRLPEADGKRRDTSEATMPTDMSK
jgi:hypothetical protein